MRSRKATGPVVDKGTHLGGVYGHSSEMRRGKGGKETARTSIAKRVRSGRLKIRGQLDPGEKVGGVICCSSL